MESSPLGIGVTTSAHGGTLIQWVFDLKSPPPPTLLALPFAALAEALYESEIEPLARDRDKPLLPPPERESATALAQHAT